MFFKDMLPRGFKLYDATDDDHLSRSSLIFWNIRADYNFSV